LGIVFAAHILSGHFSPAQGSLKPKMGWPEMGWVAHFDSSSFNA
jgi:hypothetical protein